MNALHTQLPTLRTASHPDRKIGKRIAAIASIVVAAGVAAGAVAPAHGSSAATCRLYADVPVWESSTVLAGEGARFSCTTSRTVTVLLRQDRPWLPDRTLAEVSKTGRIVFLTARRHCTSGDAMKVYTETRTNTGGKVQSGRLLTAC